MAIERRDFESGGVLGDHGITNFADLGMATPGLGGSTWGIRGSGSASERYFAEGFFGIAANGLDISSRCWDISMDCDHQDDGHSVFGYHLFSLRWNTAGAPRDFLVLNHGFGDGSLEISSTYPGFGSPLWHSAAGVYTSGVTATFRLKVLLSSAEDGGGDPLPDGEVWVYVNGTELVHLDELQLGLFTVPQMAELSIAPMGIGDNLEVSDECEGGSFANDPCCKDGGGGGGGGNPGGDGPPGGTGDVKPPDRFIIQPPWVGMCDGGALYLSAANPVNSETW